MAGRGSSELRELRAVVGELWTLVSGLDRRLAALEREVMGLRSASGPTLVASARGEASGPPLILPARGEREAEMSGVASGASRQARPRGKKAEG